MADGPPHTESERMITAACIFIPSTGPDPLARLGGVSLLKRAILSAQRAGAKTCYLVMDARPEEHPHRQEALQRDLYGDKRLTTHLVWTRPTDGPQPVRALTSGHCLYYSLATLFSPALAFDLDRAVEPGETVRVQTGTGTDALILGPQPDATFGLPVWETALLAGTPAHTAQPQAPLRTLPASSHLLYQLTDSTSLHHAESALLASLDNPKDGFVDTHLNRKLSRPLTQLFLRTTLTPNQITLLSCLIGLCGAMYFFQAGYWGPVFGVLLLQVSAVVDCCDGEVARMKFLESPLGAWLDITLDTVVHLATFAGLGFAVWAQGGTQSPFFLGGLLVGGTVLSFACVVVAERVARPDAHPQTWQDTLLRRMVSGLASRDYSLLIFICAVFQKLSWFLWTAAIGVHVFWITLAVLLYHIRRFRRAAHCPPRSTLHRRASRLP